jgi:hypothetical protein
VIGECAIGECAIGGHLCDGEDLCVIGRLERISAIGEVLCDCERICAKQKR